MLTDSLKRSIASAAQIEHETLAKRNPLPEDEIADHELAYLNGGGYAPTIPPEGFLELNLN